MLVTRYWQIKKLRIKYVIRTIRLRDVSCWMVQLKNKNMMRKKSFIHLLILMTIVTTTLMVSCSGSRAEDGGFVIEGILSDIPDSTQIVVCEDMGLEGNYIAWDTIVNGRFRLVGKTTKEGVQPARFFFQTSEEEYICITLPMLYLQPNAKIKIRGKDTDYSQWKIKSNLKTKSLP